MIRIQIVADLDSFKPTADNVNGLKIEFDSKTKIATVTAGTLGQTNLVGFKIVAAKRNSVEWDPDLVNNLLDFCQDTVESTDTAATGCSFITLEKRPKVEFYVGERQIETTEFGWVTSTDKVEEFFLKIFWVLRDAKFLNHSCIHRRKN